MDCCYGESGANGSPWGSAGGCSATALLGDNVEGVPEVISLPSLDMAGLEAAYRGVDLL